MKPTEQALDILRQYPDGLTAKGFAYHMWPDSPYWRVSYKVGRGSTRGAAVWRAAGGFLGRLVRAGLIRRRQNDSLQWVYMVERVR